jgi:hypothetical protein
MIQARPGISSTQIASILNVSRITAYTYAQALVRDGKIKIEGTGKATRYFPSDTLYINSFLREKNIHLSSSEVHTLKMNVLFALRDKYEETVTEEELSDTFEDYCMYIVPDGSIIVGFDAFILWCMDSRHDFSDRIVTKAVEYLDVIGSIEYLRGKNRFLDATGATTANLGSNMNIGFDTFYFCMPSVLRHGFGNTRTSIELRYGKKNSNKYLLSQAIEKWIDPMREYVKKNHVDAIIFTPPTEGRSVQFRDVLENMLSLTVPKIRSEKIPPFGKVLEAQKDIHDKRRRVQNALLSLEVAIPNELDFYKHIVIFDDSFTTGATPNAIALKLREAGYTGRITIITICGSFDYDLAISEDEV